jgi:hypothetical protein
MLLCCYCFFYAHPAYGGGGDFKKRTKTYVLAIGVDKPNLFIEQRPFNQPFPSCLFDAENIGNYYYYSSDSAFKNSKEFIKASNEPTTPVFHYSQDSSALIFTLTGEKASFKKLKETIELIKKQIRPEDKLVFYFSGMGENVNSGLYGTLCLFPLNDSIQLNPNKKGREGLEIELSSALVAQTLNTFTLQSFLNEVQAEEQLVILDASYGENFFPDFLRRLTTSDPLKAQLNLKKRCFIYNQGLGYETINQYGRPAGVLTSAFVQLPKKYSENFIEDRLLFEGTLYSILGLSEKAKQISKVSYESDFKYFFTNLGSTPTRGGPEGAHEEIKEEKKIVLKSKALLIATDEYDAPTWKRLDNPVFDARTIARELSNRYGFEVDTLFNKTRAELLQALIRYKTQYQYDDNSQLFIFIAGHGGYDDFVNGFITCKDSKSKDEDPLRDTYIHYSFLRDLVNSINCKHILITLDACFGGTFSGGESRNENDELYKNTERSKFIEAKLQYKSRLYLTSGGKEYVPDGRPGYHSPFAFRFIETLRSKGGKDGIITWSELTTGVESAKPLPRFGSFGDSEPGGNFLFAEKE